MIEPSPARLDRIQTVARQRQHDLTVLMERVHKPHNVAAILRTCDAVGIATAHAIPGDEGISQANHVAQGAQRWVHLERHTDIKVAAKTLKSQGFRLCAAHFCENAVDFRSIDFTKPTAVVLGTELHGVSEEAVALCDESLVIPMLGMTQSLNVSVANAVILYEAQRQRSEANRYAHPSAEEESLNNALAQYWVDREVAKIKRQPLSPDKNPLKI